MKVFISWSGERSRAVAQLLEEWLQCVLQGSKPWMSANGIERGALWFSEITGQLQATHVGIICLTQENRNAPWIMFEAGALAKGLPTNRVCTFLIDLSAADIANPLAQFNHTLPTREGVLLLVQTLNLVGGEPFLADAVLKSVFDTYWPQFEAKFREAVEANPPSDGVVSRSEPDKIDEVLGLVRALERRLTRFERGITAHLDLELSPSTDVALSQQEQDRLAVRLSTLVSSVPDDQRAELIAQIDALKRAEIPIQDQWRHGKRLVAKWNGTPPL